MIQEKKKPVPFTKGGFASILTKQQKALIQAKEREKEFENLSNYLDKKIKSLGWKDVFFTIIKAKRRNAPDSNYHDLHMR